MYKICIVDDEQKARDRLEKMLLEYDDSQDTGGFEVFKYSNAASYLRSNDTDSSIIFLDIDMPEMNGLELAKKIRETRTDVIIIFCTNLQQFAINGYEVNAFGFIVKPIGWYSFRFFLDKAVKKLKGDGAEGNIRIKTVGGQTLIHIRNIRYIEVRLHNLFYHICGNGDIANDDYAPEEVLQARGTMQDVEKQLEKYDFIRCSISYLVNLNHVTAIKGNDVHLSQTVLPISRNQKKAFTEAFMKFLSKREVVI